MVFAGEFWAGASARGLSAGFEDLGWAVQEVDYRHYTVRSSGSQSLRIASRLTRSAAHRAYQADLLKVCRVLQPDIFLTVKGMALSAELLRDIRRTGARTVMYYPDVSFDHAGVSQDSFSEYDLFVTTKLFHIRYLEDLLGNSRVAHVPHGYSSIHSAVADNISGQNFAADVIHAGNHSLFKQTWLEAASSALPAVSFRLVGNRWSINAGHGALAAADMPGERIGVAYAEAIQSARINVAIHMGPTASGWQDMVSTRTFEIPACRGFMLHIDNDEVRELFEAGVEIDVFRSREELVDKIQFYLSRPDLRARMVERAFNRCVPAYSYRTRAQQIVQILDQ